MKPLYLLLLLLMACGFFACTTDMTQQPAEIAPVPEGKTLDAESFAEFTELLVDFGLFKEDDLVTEEDYGAGDFRLFFDKTGELELETLTKGIYLSATEHTDPIATLPARNWTNSIELGFTPSSADRLNKWLVRNFNGNQAIDLRIAILENGTILFQGIPTTAKAKVDFPLIEWF